MFADENNLLEVQWCAKIPLSHPAFLVCQSVSLAVVMITLPSDTL